MGKPFLEYVTVRYQQNSQCTVQHVGLDEPSNHWIQRISLNRKARPNENHHLTAKFENRKWAISNGDLQVIIEFMLCWSKF